jgi:hypothetical protein
MAQGVLKMERRTEPPYLHQQRQRASRRANYFRRAYL